MDERFCKRKIAPAYIGRIIHPWCLTQILRNTLQIYRGPSFEMTLDFSSRARNRFRSRRRKRLEQVHSMHTFAVVVIVVSHTDTARCTTHTKDDECTTRRRLMAQEGRDRNSFQARGPSAEEKNIQHDKSRSILDAILISVRIISRQWVIASVMIADNNAISHRAMQIITYSIALSIIKREICVRAPHFSFSDGKN